MAKYRTISTLTVERVRELFAYDPETGKLTWKTRSSPRACRALVGQEAGGFLNGYRIVSVDGGDAQASQVAWMVHYGQKSRTRLRYINGDKTDLRIANLEESGVPEAGQFSNTPEGRAAYGRAHRAAHPRIHRNADLRKSFGISIEEYDAMHAAQNGVCAICARPERARRGDKTKWLAVDHDHKTGKVRGLLCTPCNIAIGNFEDNEERLFAAVDYLRKHSDDPSWRSDFISPEEVYMGLPSGWLN